MPHFILNVLISMPCHSFLPVTNIWIYEMKLRSSIGYLGDGSILCSLLTGSRTIQGLCPFKLEFIWDWRFAMLFKRLNLGWIHAEMHRVFRIYPARHFFSLVYAWNSMRCWRNTGFYASKVGPAIHELDEAQIYKVTMCNILTFRFPAYAFLFGFQRPRC